MPQRPHCRNQMRRPTWATALLIAISLVLGAMSLLGCQAGPTSLVAETETPLPQATPTAVPLPPTWTPVPPPTATTAPTPTPTVDPQALTRITIVHSNDTWGYTLPCG